MEDLKDANDRLLERENEQLRSANEVLLEDVDMSRFYKAGFELIFLAIADLFSCSNTTPLGACKYMGRP